MHEHEELVRSELAAGTWDLPVTDTWVAGVVAGVRRRRRVRRWGAAGSLAGVAAVVVLAALLAGLPPRQEQAEPGSAAPVAGADLDGFVIGYVPAGLVRQVPDSVGTTLAGPDGVQQEDVLPGPEQIPVLFTSRWFQAPDNQRGLFIGIWRPVPSGADAGTRRRLAAEHVASFLGAGAAGADQVDGSRIGRAVWVESRGSEVTTRSVVITTPTDTVVSIEPRGSFTREELARVVRGLTRSPSS